MTRTETPDSVMRVPREGGFSMTELMISVALVVPMMIVLHSTLSSATKSRVNADHTDHRTSLAYDYTQRLVRIPFGTALDSAAVGSQLSELFDDDQDLGTATLKSLEVGDKTHQWTTVIEGVTTSWLCQVSSDLDGDGTKTGFREGRTDLLRISLWANGSLMFDTTRAAGFANTRKD